jgi:hypothetical protein
MPNWFFANLTQANLIRIVLGQLVDRGGFFI